MDRRDFVFGTAAGLATGAAAPGFALAQDAYPTRPITIINPFPPGGVADAVIRPFASALEQIIKQAVVVETKAGSAGAIGAQVAASSKPDGYSLLVHIVSLLGFAEVDRINGRPVKFTMDDFVPLARFVADPNVLLVNADLPYKTLKDLVDDAKKRPNQLLYSSSGFYGASHLPTALFLDAAGIQMKHLPTPGGGPALTAVLGNNAQLTIISFAGAAAQIRAGKLRALACFGDKRVSTYPDVPTLKELGYDIEFYIWCGLFAPKGTPEPIVTRLRDEARKTVTGDAFKGSMGKLNQDIHYLDQPAFRDFLQTDTKRVEHAVRLIGKV